MRASEPYEKSMVFHYIYRILALINLVFSTIAMPATFGVFALVYHQLTSYGVEIDPLTVVVTVILGLFSVISYVFLVFIAVGLWFYKRWLPDLIHAQAVLIILSYVFNFSFTVLTLYVAGAFETEALATIFNLLLAGIKLFIGGAIYWWIDLYYQGRKDYFKN